MKKELILQLLQTIKNNKLLLDGVNNIAKAKDKTVFESLFNLSDSEVENILSIENDKLKLFQIYLYLHKKEIPKEVYTILEQEMFQKNENLYALIPILLDEKKLFHKDILLLIDTILSGNTLSVLKVSDLLDNKEIRNHNKLLQIVEEIANCKYEYLASALINALKSSVLLKREDFLNFIYVIAHSSGKTQAKYASILVNNPKIMKKDRFNSLELIKAIAYAEEEYQAINAYMVAKNELVLSKPNALEFVRIVANTFGESKCEYVKDTAICEVTLTKPNALNYVKAVSLAKDEQVRATMLTATNSVVLKSSSSLENTMTVGQAIGKKQASIAYLVAADTSLINRKDLNDIVKIIANASGEVQAELAYNLCSFNDIFNREDMIEYIKLIASTKNKDNAQRAFSTIRNKTCLDSFASLKIVRLIANAQTDYQAFFISEGANSFELISNPNHIEALELISKSLGEIQANLGYTIATNSHFMNLSNFIDYVKLFANCKNQEQLYITYNICLYILTMSPEVLEHQEGLKCIEMLLNTPVSILNKCQTQIFIKPELSPLENIRIIYSEIEKETRKMINIVKNRKGLNENSIDLFINSISKLEKEDIVSEDIVKVKIMIK